MRQLLFFRCALFVFILVYCCFWQKSCAIGRILGGQISSSHDFPGHAGSKPRLERWTLCRGSMYKRMRLGPESGSGSHPLGCRYWQWGHLWGTVTLMNKAIFFHFPSPSILAATAIEKKNLFPSSMLKSSHCALCESNTLSIEDWHAFLLNEW